MPLCHPLLILCPAATPQLILRLTRLSERSAGIPTADEGSLHRGTIPEPDRCAAVVRQATTQHNEAANKAHSEGLLRVAQRARAEAIQQRDAILRGSKQMLRRHSISSNTSADQQHLLMKPLAPAVSSPTAHQLHINCVHTPFRATIRTVQRTDSPTDLHSTSAASQSATEVCVCSGSPACGWRQEARHVCRQQATRYWASGL